MSVVVSIVFELTLLITEVGTQGTQRTMIASLRRSR